MGFLGIDHPLIAVRDIAAVRARYEALGFTMTPVGRHPWGTSTALAMFDRCALELMGIYDEGLLDESPAGPFRFGRVVEALLREREGVTMVALHSGDAEGDAATVLGRGIASQGAIAFGRDVVLPDGRRDRTATTLRILHDPALPRLSNFICQQHRPELIYVPSWLEHPNGAAGITQVTVLAGAAALPLVRARLTGLYGAARVETVGEGFCAWTGNGRFLVLDRPAAERCYGPAPVPEGSGPCCIAVHVRVTALARLLPFLPAGAGWRSRGGCGCWMRHAMAGCSWRSTRGVAGRSFEGLRLGFCFFRGGVLGMAGLEQAGGGMRIETVGVIGLGNMGLPMAATLVRRGFRVSGYDLGVARRELAGGEGVQAVETLEALLGSVDAVVSSLPYGRDVEAVLTGGDALLRRTDRRVVVVDTSTADPSTSRRLAQLLGAAGHGHLDAPVSGGPAGAAEGQLTMMIGGSAQDFADAGPVIEAIAAKAVHVGPSGSGNVAKLINNMLVAAHMLTTGEAMRLAEAAGVSAEAVLQVVNAATGRSGISEVHFPRWIMSDRFDSGFAAGLMRKDVGLAAELAAEVGIDLPLSRAVARLWLEDRTAVPDEQDFTRMSGYRPRGEGSAT